MKTGYFFAIDDQSVGPLDEGTIKQRISSHAITRETLAWCEGMDDWRPVRAIPELLQTFGPEEASVARPPPLPGVAGRAGHPPPPPQARSRNDSEAPSEAPVATEVRRQGYQTAEKTTTERGTSYRWLMQILPKRSPLRPYLERNPGMAPPILVMALVGLMLILAFLADTQTEEAGYAKPPTQQLGAPVGNWQEQHRAWRDAQSYTQGIYDDTNRRRLEAEDRMDDLRRRATFPDLYGGNND